MQIHWLVECNDGDPVCARQRNNRIGEELDGEDGEEGQAMIS